MTKLRIIHIHTDLKFIGSTKIFENERFENTIIVIGHKYEYNGVYKDTALFFEFSIKNLDAIINLCKIADMVVMYDLNFSKAYITNRLPNPVKIVWRFFGLELYSKMGDYVYSEKTTAILSQNSNQNLLNATKRKIIDLYNLIRFHTTSKNEFEKAAFNRIDYFFGLSDTEYYFLKNYWPQLPPFVQLGYHWQINSSENRSIKNNTIIVGNNRSAYNNHFDIIDVINDSDAKKSYSFLLLFNYGQNNNYSNAVRQYAEKVDKIQIIENFLSIDKFDELYKTAAAFVLNGYRQMAMGNIFTAIRNNVKIYINRKNVIFNWLRKEGILVFSIEDFKVDLIKQNVKLTEEEINYNQKQIRLFMQKYNLNDFHEKIYDIIVNSNPCQYRVS